MCVATEWGAFNRKFNWDKLAIRDEYHESEMLNQQGDGLNCDKICSGRNDSDMDVYRFLLLVYEIKHTLLC